MLFNININNFIKKIFILQILCLKVLFAQEVDFQANPEKATSDMHTANARRGTIKTRSINFPQHFQKFLV